MAAIRRSLLTLAAATLLLQGCAGAPPPAYKGPTLAIAQSERGVLLYLPSSVLFELGRADFDTAAAEPYLTRVATLLKTKTDKRVQVEGHTDSAGADALNQPLSEGRALGVLKALVAQGVPAQRLTSAGYSSKRPLAANSTEDGRRLNRRVELVILDEKVENITRGEPANAFESAFDKLKAMVENGLVRAPEAQP